MHVSNGALASFADTLPLLHPFGRLQCHDLFVTDVGRVPDRVPRAGQVRRLGGELGQRPAAAARRAAGAASTCASRRSRSARRPTSSTLTARCGTDRADDTCRHATAATGRATAGCCPPPSSARTRCPSGWASSKNDYYQRRISRALPERDPRHGDQGGDQGPGPRGHRHRLRRRAAPRQRRRLLAARHARRADPAPGQGRLLRLLRRQR